MIFRLMEDGGFDFCVEAESKAKVREYFSAKDYSFGVPQNPKSIYKLKDAWSLFGYPDESKMPSLQRRLR